MFTSTTLDRMEKSGTGFERKLAELYRYADSQQQQRLEHIFRDLFEHFENMID